MPGLEPPALLPSERGRRVLDQFTSRIALDPILDIAQSGTGTMNNNQKKSLPGETANGRCSDIAGKGP
jgi:hypothetical protein